MSFVAAAVVGSAVIGGVVQSKAAGKAADAQTAAADAGIGEQRRQFDKVQELLSPYADAGTQALSGQLALAGLSGSDAQQAAITSIEQGPQFEMLRDQGETAILQNASATGGLRGGNVQGALAQFRPQLLSGLIEQQYGRLGGIAASGQNASAGLGTAATNMGNNVSNLYGQQGAAQAGGAVAGGQAFGNVLGGIGRYAGAVSTGQVANPFGGDPNVSFNNVSGPMRSSIRPQGAPF